MKMDKKALMLTIVLLALSMIIISPVKAITKDEYNMTLILELDLVNPGIQWVSEEGILHIRAAHWVGTVEGDLGTGTYDGWVDVNVNLVTGEGTVSEKWLITITSLDTIAGSNRGKITMPFMSGTSVGTNGTGEFEGAKMMGSWEGFHTDLTHIVATSWGTITYPLDK